MALQGSMLHSSPAAAKRPHGHRMISHANKISTGEGAAYPWILEHILAYPGNYDIPLRTMYTSNVMAQTHTGANTPSLSDGSSPDNSPISPESPNFGPEQHGQAALQSATEHFKLCLMEQISEQPHQPFSLPPSFITSFVRRCFTEDLCLVDFTQALTALDYLKDLESRRKRELSAANIRLGAAKMSSRGRTDETASAELEKWMTGMEDKGRRVEALYTQVYIGLRRWTLINEMRLTPFSKANCIAMLNTLYPPSLVEAPTRQLTTTILDSQRDAFFRYIRAVEKSGKSVLSNLENQSRRPQDENGWPVVREIVDKYLRAANSIIEECFAVTVDIFKTNKINTTSINSNNNSERPQMGTRISGEIKKDFALSKTNSGLSFNEKRSPSLGTSTPVSYCPTPVLMSEATLNKPLPPSPRVEEERRSGATLKRIALEIKRMKSYSKGSSSGADTAPSSPTLPSSGFGKEPERPTTSSGSSFYPGKSLRKQQSTTTLRRGASKSSLSSVGHSRTVSADTPNFTIDDEQREYLINRARAAREREQTNVAPKSRDISLKRVQWRGPEDSPKPQRAETFAMFGHSH